MTGHDVEQHVRALQAAASGDYSGARSLLGQLPSGPPARLVRVDPEIFSHRNEPGQLEMEREYGLDWQISPAFLVITPDPERALYPVHRAARRIHSVTRTGRSCAEWESSDEYTPNYVSDVYLADQGLAVFVDTKGELAPAMGHAMLRILVDELIADGIRALITAPPTGFDFSTPTWKPPVEPEASGESRQQAWYIARPVAIDVGDGRSYWDCEYRRPDGTWTFDKSVAERFPLTSAPNSHFNDLISALRREARPAGTGEVTGLRLDV